jgi:N-acetylglucosamine transport system permease protein
MFPNAGGPANTTLVMSQELFNTAFRKGQFGYATAMGVVLAAVTMAFAAIAFFIFRLVKGRESGKAKR